MSYLALYRKYRPTNFSSVVGQDTTVKVLINSIKNNHISHAYLFTGPRGTGKTSIAKIFAKAVNCTNFIDDICNKCDVCNALKENDSDIIEIDAASNNGVDEIRTLRDNVKLMPSFCKYKIYIIDEVHMLSTGAFNALLKTLEEPPSHVIFILATTEPQKIPLTILSRCQRFDFHRVDVPNIVQRLKYIIKEENGKLDDKIVEYIAKSSDGCLRDAINLLDQVLSLNKDKETTTEDVDLLSGKISNSTLIKFLNGIIDADYTSVLELSNSFSENGKDYLLILDWLLSVMRDKLVNEKVNNYFDEEYTLLLNSLKIDSSIILGISNLINNAIVDIKQSNNQKILFDIYMLQIINTFFANNRKDNKEVIKETVVEDKKEEVEKNEDNEKEIVEEETKKEAKVDDNKVETENAEEKVEEAVEEVTEEEITETVKTEETVEDNKETYSNKEIRINNALATADKEQLKIVKDGMSNIDNFMSNKKYIGLIDLLSNSNIVVASNEYLLFSFDEEADTLIFDTNIDKIEKLLKEAFDKTYKVASVSSAEWNNLKEEYKIRKKNNIPYVIMDESIVKLEKKKNNNEIENTASLLFGEDVIDVN